MILQHLNWTEMGVVVALVSVVVAHVKNVLDHRDKRSQFYLEQIKTYFSKAIELLTTKHNDNIIWHQAIECLEVVDNLKKNLTEKSHQSIYIAEHVYITYFLANVVSRINDHKFFYGVKDYTTKDSIALYNESIDNQKPWLRIDPEKLYLIGIFMERAIRFKSDKKESDSKKLFQKYFKEKLDRDEQISEFTKSIIQAIFSYIEDYNRQASLVK